jgi:cytochrome d ubiquinol oxidase subunit I
MNYPVWDVPHLGNGLVVAIIAIFHVMIAHFAVGGGLYLAMAERRALKSGNKDWMEFLPRHSKFFMILTGVFGAVSGVGIWFSVGLASPAGTSTLIHNFVFGWAIEWVFFIVELSAAAVYYYTWGRISDQLHLKIGWLYAGASLATLVIINGILTFMLTPGSTWLEVAGTGRESSVFFNAFFNPTYWPSLALRILSCFALAGVWALITGSMIDGHEKPALKSDVVRWSTGWLVPAFFLMPPCLLWYMWMLPESRLELAQFGISTIGAGVFSQVTRTLLVSVMASATILAVAYLAAYRKPTQLRLGYALGILFLALAATGASEMARELLRKPYVIADYMYSNAIRKKPIEKAGWLESEIDRFNEHGYLTQSIWLPASHTGADRGQLMFRGQCLACHTVNGYRSMSRLLHGRNRESIANILNMLHDRTQESHYQAFMPPLVGTETEINDLVDYLSQLANSAEQGDDEAVVAQRVSP